MKKEFKLLWKRVADAPDMGLKSCLMAMAMGATLVAASSLTPARAGQQTFVDTAASAYVQSIETWRAKRMESLARSDGWLTVVAMEWLKEGENQIGSAAGNDIQLSSGPARWGTLVLRDDGLNFINLGGDLITINGVSLTQSRLAADTQGKATVVASGALSFYVIFRGSYALRVKDAQAPARLQFKGVDHYPVDPSWRVDGRFEPAPQGTTIEIANVLGQVSETKVLGTVEFERQGKTRSLLAIEEGVADMWIIFTDLSNGHGTYGAGRFLHSEGMPVNGHLTIDFNKAYNPPCAFTDFATCPLPPQRNRMDMEVTAGELDFHNRVYQK